MQASGILSWRALANRVHTNPLPLSKKESQQLLSLLDSSFNRQLDRYHPSRNSTPSKNVPDTTSLPLHRSHDTKPSIGSLQQSSQASFSDHLLDVLNHPLLARKTRPDIFPKDLDHATKVPQFAKALSWLEQKFAHGHVSLQDIHVCLKALCRTDGPIHDQRRNDLRQLGASRKIEAWLRAEESLSLLDISHDHKTSGLWMKLIVVEGRHDSVWNILASKESNSSFILCKYIVAELWHGEGFEAAVRELVRLKKENPSLPLGYATRPLMQWLSTFEETISPTVLDDLMKCLAGTRWARFDTALIMLFHPTRPNCDKAYDFIKSLNEDEVKQYTMNRSGSAKVKAKIHLMVSMTLRLACRLIDEGRLDDARVVFRFMHSNFSDELDIQQAMSDHVEQPGDRPEASKEEQSYIRSLDALLAT